MLIKILKISFVFFSLIFLSGCLQSTALLGPGVTIATSGNILQAGIQYGANTALKNETGKDTLEHLQEAVESQSQSYKFKRKLSNLVEKQFKITREKLKIN